MSCLPSSVFRNVKSRKILLLQLQTLRARQIIVGYHYKSAPEALEWTCYTTNATGNNIADAHRRFPHSSCAVPQFWMFQFSNALFLFYVWFCKNTSDEWYYSWLHFSVVSSGTSRTSDWTVGKNTGIFWRHGAIRRWRRIRNVRNCDWWFQPDVTMHVKLQNEPVIQQTRPEIILLTHADDFCTPHRAATQFWMLLKHS
jgi:hypothetical protein